MFFERFFCAPRSFRLSDFQTKNHFGEQHIEKKKTTEQWRAGAKVQVLLVVTILAKVALLSQKCLKYHQATQWTCSTALSEAKSW